MAARAVLAGHEGNLECHEIRASCGLVLDLGFARVVGDTAYLPARDGHVQIDAASPHTMAQREFAEIPIGGPSNGTGQIAAAVATKLN
jgi:hypothetical protein